jgi:hypothetical protein
VKNIFRSLFYLTLGFGIFESISGCNRPSVSNQMSNITFVAPNKSELLAKVTKLNETLPANKSFCFAVTVKGQGIEESVGTIDKCQSSVGLSAGFVLDGELLTLDVPKGSSRNFDLYLYLAEPGTVCPVFNSSFLSTNEAYSKTYKVGSALGVSLAHNEETVAINLEFKGVAQNLAADLGRVSCSDQSVPIVEVPLIPKLRAVLYSDGSIVEAGFDVSILSKSWIESFFNLLVDTFDLYHIEAIGNGHNTVQDLMTAGGITVPPYLHSFTADPLSGELYALSDGGDILKISRTDGSLVDYSCPFSTCNLPMWVQSISVGRGGKLYALDHSGQIYEVQSTGLSLLADAVLPSVVQVLYY